MILDSIIALVVLVLGPVFALLPEFSLMEQLPAALDNLGFWLGGALSPFNILFPFSEMASAVRLAFVVLVPALLAYKLANWVWRHIPSIGGFGPGAG